MTTPTPEASSIPPDEALGKLEDMFQRAVKSGHIEAQALMKFAASIALLRNDDTKKGVAMETQRDLLNAAISMFRYAASIELLAELMKASNDGSPVELALLVKYSDGIEEFKKYDRRVSNIAQLFDLKPDQADGKKTEA